MTYQPCLDIDLDIPDWFGYWFAGLADGESHFCLNPKEVDGRRNINCYVSIALRSDDIAVLELILETLRIGRLYRQKGWKTGHDLIVWKVQRCGDLKHVIVPLLEKYPLRSKKCREFELWKKAVDIVRFSKKHRNTPLPRYMWEEVNRLAHQIQLCRAFDPLPLEQWLSAEKVETENEKQDA